MMMGRVLSIRSIHAPKMDGLLGGLAEEGVAAGARIPFRGGI
jgi:hypothetical protein